MPELPEVEATRQHLMAWSTGAPVVAIWRDRDPEPGDGDLVGRRLGAWTRHGKRLTGHLDGGGHLALHLGMTGKVLRDPSPERPHLRVLLTFEDGRRVGLLDRRRLGHLRYAGAPPDQGALGPDALALLAEPGARGAELARALGGASRGLLKDRALDQGRLAGLGNIAIIEGCHRAGLHPHRLAASLSPGDWDRLASALHDHLLETLSDCLGTEDLQYVSDGGPNPFRVYGRAGQPCPTCGGGPIGRTVHKGRPTFSCPSCQPEPP